MSLSAMSWYPVFLFMPVTFVREFGWPQSEEVLAYLRSGDQKVVRYERPDADEDFPNAPGRWRSCCSERWDLTDEVKAWQALPGKPTGRMPEEPNVGFFVEAEQMDSLQSICKALYGDGASFTADSRRDLAHRLHYLLGRLVDQPVAA